MEYRPSKISNGLRALMKVRHRLTDQQYRSLKGYIKAGQFEIAAKALETMLKNA